MQFNKINIKLTTAIVIALMIFVIAYQRLATPVTKVDAQNPHGPTPEILRFEDAEFLVLFDVSASESTDERRKRARFLNPLVRMCDGRCAFTICTFASVTHELVTIRPYLPDEMWSVLDEKVIDAKGENDTNWLPVIEKIKEAHFNAVKTKKQLVVIVMTNGGLSDMPQVEANAMQLAGLPALNTLIIGPLTYGPYAQNRSTSCYEKIKSALSPMRQKLIVFPESKSDAGMERAFKELKERLR